MIEITLVDGRRLQYLPDEKVTVVAQSDYTCRPKLMQREVPARELESGSHWIVLWDGSISINAIESVSNNRMKSFHPKGFPCS